MVGGYFVVPSFTNQSAEESVQEEIIDTKEEVPLPKVSEQEDTQIKVANPASVYCEKQGGESKTYNLQTGDYGVCIFSDGQECEEWAFYRGECKPLTGQELENQEQQGDNIVQISNINMLKYALNAVKEICIGSYPKTLDLLIDDSVCDGGALITQIPKDVFTGKDYIYQSSGSDYELKYFLDLLEGESTSGYEYNGVIPDYNDGWNTATKDYLSREGGH